MKTFLGSLTSSMICWTCCAERIANCAEGFEKVLYDKSNNITLGRCKYYYERRIISGGKLGGFESFRVCTSTRPDGARGSMKACFSSILVNERAEAMFDGEAPISLLMDILVRRMQHDVKWTRAILFRIKLLLKVPWWNVRWHPYRISYRCA